MQMSKILSFSKSSHWVSMIQNIFNINIYAKMQVELNQNT